MQNNIAKDQAVCPSAFNETKKLLFQKRTPQSGSRYPNAFEREIIMKSHLVLLLTRDVELEQQSSMAAAASGARLEVTTTVGEALQAVCEHGREIDLVVIDFDNGTRGMTLLSALNILRDQVLIVALTSAARDHSAVLAYAEGAACCLTKPMNAVELEMVIRLLDRRRVQLNAAQSKGEPNHANSRELQSQFRHQKSNRNNEALLRGSSSNSLCTPPPAVAGSWRCLDRAAGSEHPRRNRRIRLYRRSSAARV